MIDVNKYVEVECKFFLSNGNIVKDSIVMDPNTYTEADVIELINTVDTLRNKVRNIFRDGSINNTAIEFAGMMIRGSDLIGIKINMTNGNNKLVND